MTDFISQDGLQVQNTKFSSVLLPVQYQHVCDEISGRIFQEKDFAEDWDSVWVHPSDLDYGTAQKFMRKITSPSLIMASHSPKMAFVLASEDEPVYICSGVKRTETAGYTLVFGLKPAILPDYLFYMSRYESWVSVSKRIDAEEKYGTSIEFVLKWSDVGAAFSDMTERNIDYLTAEVVFTHGLSQNHGIDIQIPPLFVQEQRVADAKSLEKILQEKMAEKERKFQQKEWLNEAHIRNSKHRLSNEMMPISMAVERLQNFLKEHPDGIKSSDIIGKITKQSVSDLLEDLSCLVKNVEIEIENLTKSEQAGEPEQTLNVALTLDDYLDKIAPKYPIPFNIEKVGFEKELNIKISPKAFTELIDNIVGNAVRHGFIGNRNDYLLQVSIGATDDGMCEIAIANNGEPMSERARATFFEQGSFAGPTGHTGIGGYRIYDICDKAGGEAVAPYSKDGFPVVICVKFPLVKYSDHDKSFVDR